MEQIKHATNSVNGIGKTLLTGLAAADYLEHNIKTLERWRKTGAGPAFYKVGRKCMYSPSDLDIWLDTRKFTNTAQVKTANRAARAVAL